MRIVTTVAGCLVRHLGAVVTLISVRVPYAEGRCRLAKCISLCLGGARRHTQHCMHAAEFTWARHLLSGQHDIVMYSFVAAEVY
jgi:hypothetical protein